MAGLYGGMGCVDEGDIARLGSRLSHRGSVATIWSPGPDAHLGWRHQKAVTNSRTPSFVPLIFSGAIYNRAELAALVGRGRGVRSVEDDAELLWGLYASFGSDAFALINGQFALALYEAATGSVILATDRWAAQPLYFAVDHGRCAFASEIKALLALDWLAAEPDREALHSIATTKYLPNNRSPVAGIIPVPPNSWVRLRPGAYEIEPYHRLTVNIVERADESHALELRRTILAAAERLVAGFDTIGIALSAGLDSALTLAAVRAVAPKKRIYTFTAAYDPDDPDLARAAEVARHFGTVHREVLLAPEDLQQLLPQLVWLIEDPICREELLAYLALTREAARHVPLMLYGQLADVLFAGMPRHLLIKAASTYRWLRDPIGEFYGYTQTGARPRSPAGRLLVAGYFRGRQTHPPQVLGASAAGAGKTLDLASHEPLNAALLASLAAGPTEVAAMERLHAAAGLSYGSIFHDQDVARCAFSIPDRLKIRGRTRKYILRQAALGFMPEAFTARPKGMIRVVHNVRLNKAVDALADELLSPHHALSRGLFDVKDIERLRRHGAGYEFVHDQFYHLWTMLLIEIWARTFIDGRGVGPIRLGHRDRAEPRSSVARELETAL